MASTWTQSHCIWDVANQEIHDVDAQRLRDARHVNMDQHLVKSMTQRIKADPKAQGTQNVDLKKIKSVMHFYELTAFACEV